MKAHTLHHTKGSQCLNWNGVSGYSDIIFKKNAHFEAMILQAEHSGELCDYY